MSGDQTKEFTALRQGIIDIAVGSTINGSPQVKELNLFALPFLMPDHKAIDALTQGRVGTKLFELLSQRDVVPLAWGENGFREVSNSKHPIRTPADLKGLKMRVVGSPLFLATMSALGANPTQMSWADAQPAMATGAVDGQENPLAVFSAAKLHTVGQKHLTLWGYVADPLIFVVNNKVWDSWTPADRELVREAALMLLIPAIVISRRHGFSRDRKAVRPPLGRSLVDAIWGLLAPVIILGGLRTGLFTPTEAAVVAVAYGIFVGMVIYRTITPRSLFRLLVDAGELSAVLMMIIGIASVFAWAGNTLGIFDAVAQALVGLHANEWLMLLSVNLLLLVAGMFLDAISVFLILLPLLVAVAMGWDLVWFGVMMTINLAIGQFTPPMAPSLMITARIAGIGMDETFRWVVWLVVAMLGGLALMIVFPQLALWLPGRLGYL